MTTLPLGPRPPFEISLIVAHRATKRRVIKAQTLVVKLPPLGLKRHRGATFNNEFQTWLMPGQCRVSAWTMIELAAGVGYKRGRSGVAVIRADAME